MWTLGDSIQTIMLDLHRNRPLYTDNGIHKRGDVRHAAGDAVARVSNSIQLQIHGRRGIAQYCNIPFQDRYVELLLTDIGKQILGLVDAGEPLSEDFDMCVSKWKANKDLQVTILSGVAY